MQRAVLITGGAQRLGAAMSRWFAAHGWQVLIHHHRSHEAAHALAADLGGAPVLCGDLADPATPEALMAEAHAIAPGLCALINNAAIFEHDDWQSLNPHTWQRHMEINAYAPAALVCALARQLMGSPSKQQRGATSSQGGAFGAVVNIIDQRVWRLNPDFLSYTASKAALWTLTQTLAQALAPHIRINAIGPGPTLASRHQNADMFQAEARLSPLQEAVQPDQIAQAAEYLLTAPTVTGQMIAVDSGQHLAWQTPDVLAQMPH